MFNLTIIIIIIFFIIFKSHESINMKVSKRNIQA